MWSINASHDGRGKHVTRSRSDFVIINELGESAFGIDWHVNNPNQREIPARNRINLLWKTIARACNVDFGSFSQRVLNFHTCFMSYPESKAKYAKAKRIDKHSIGNRGIVERTVSHFKSILFYSLFSPVSAPSQMDGLIRKLGHS